MVKRSWPLTLIPLVIACFAATTLSPDAHAQRPGGFPGRGGGPPPARTEDKPGDSSAPSGQAGGADSPALTVSVSDKGMSIFAVNADAHDVFSKIAAAANLPLIVDDTVQGQVTLNIVNKPAKDLLARLVDAYGFSFSEVGQVYVISEGVPKKPSSYLLGDIEAVTTKYVQPARARSLLPLFLQSEVKMNTDQNAVVLSGPRAVLDKFRKDVEQFDIPAAQIMLDVLVVEYTDMDTDTFAANLGYRNDDLGITTDSVTGQAVLTAITDLPRDFYASLQALVVKNRARVRANPRVATVSGLYANVFIGQQRYLSKPVNLPSGGGQSNYIDAGVRLNMRPLTGGQGEIILYLDQEISTLSAPDADTGLPNKTKRTAFTTVRVRDGQTVVIGGLRQAELRETHSRIPIISEIPIVGELFKSHRIENTNVELAVFITARILDRAGHLPADEERRIRSRFLEGSEAVRNAGPAG
jgi:type II secretory pathway component GspD/PulD (secretin)